MLFFFQGGGSTFMVRVYVYKFTNTSQINLSRNLRLPRAFYDYFEMLI